MCNLKDSRAGMLEPTSVNYLYLKIIHALTWGLLYQLKTETEKCLKLFLKSPIKICIFFFCVVQIGMSYRSTYRKKFNKGMMEVSLANKVPPKKFLQRDYTVEV